MLPVFDCADLVCGDKANVSLMKELQILQNKAAKLILGGLVHSSFIRQNSKKRFSFFPTAVRSINVLGKTPVSIVKEFVPRDSSLEGSLVKAG